MTTMKALTALGLDNKEAGIYLALLALGDAPIADLVDATGEHPQIVNRMVDRLIAKGLVLSATRKHRRYVRAESPKVLEESEANKLRQLREALPDLLALQRRQDNALVRVAKGTEAVVQLRTRAFKDMKEGSTYYVVGASGDRFYEVVGDRHAAIEKLRIDRKIKKKLIAFESQRRSLEKNDVHRKYADFRFLPLAYSVPSSTNIFDDTVAILIWTPEPIVITIESPEVARSYRDYFSALWKAAVA